MLIQGLQKLTLLDFPGHISCTVFTGGCNMRCPYCHNGSLALGQGDVSISPEELLAFLDSRAGRLEGICISGGEPTLHPDLPELIRRIKARGFKVKLDTNGSNPEMLLALIDEGLLDYVAMDIKNSPAKYHLTAGLGEYRVGSAECRTQSADSEKGFVSTNTLSLLGAFSPSLHEESELPAGRLPKTLNVSHEISAERRVQSAEGSLNKLSSDGKTSGRLTDEVAAEQHSNYPSECVFDENIIHAKNLPIMEKIKHSCDILLQNLVDFEFRTTLVRELHTEDDIRAIGKWLSGNEKFFLQTYRDEGDLLVGGFTAYTPEETRHLLEILREYIPSAEIRG